MKKHVLDEKMLQSITPVQISSYLQSRGAYKTGERLNKVIIWQYNKEEIFMPLGIHSSDYVGRVANVLSLLEKIENRSQVEIVEDICHSDFDVIRIINKDVLQETFICSMDCMRYACDLLVASACSAVTYKSSYSGLLPQEAERFMKNILFGGLENFVLRLLVPAENEFESYEQSVIPTFESGLQALQLAAQQSVLDHKLSRFITAIPQGVTSNLCDAITNMYDSVQPKHIEICISYSCNRNQPRPLARIYIKSEYIPIIREASAYIKSFKP